MKKKYENALLDFLTRVDDPVSMKRLDVRPEEVVVDTKNQKVIFSIGTDANKRDDIEKYDAIIDMCKKKITEVTGGYKSSIALTNRLDAEAKASKAGVQNKKIPTESVGILKHVRNILLVSSGKGGVGKSTVAANIAVSISSLGYKVGLMDADLYGPSIPTLFGLSTKVVQDEDKIIPHKKYGIKLMSSGFIVDQKTASLWRGPMASKTLMHLINNTKWGY